MPSVTSQPSERRAGDPAPFTAPLPDIGPVHERIAAAVEDLGPRLTALSLALHADPELSLDEHRAADRLTAALADEGFTIERPVAGLDTGFVARFGSGAPTIAFLCEYDALPGVGHGCGHNLIAAGGLGAALALRRAYADHLESGGGSLLCIGTPGEEGKGGKITELDAGVFDDVDAALMFHPGDKTVPWRHATACVHLDVVFHGVAAHAAGSPARGRSALAGVIQLFNAIDSLRQFTPESARIHGIITDGGQAVNIVPERAAASLMVRALTRRRTEALTERVRACVQAAADATGTTVEIETGLIYAERKNNHTIATRWAGHFGRLGGIVEEPVLRGGTGSSDIGNVSLVLPAIHPYLQIADRGTPGHSHALAAAAGSPAAQEQMLRMAEALACTGADLFDDPGLLTEARDEFATSGPDLPG